MNVQQALNYARDILSRAGGESPEVDANFLLTHLLEKNRTWLKTWPEFELTKAQQAQFVGLVERRELGEPVAYVVGQQAFWTLQLETNPSTLIPRPETELLVEQALAFLSAKDKAKILDLGTGTGAIALAIAKERPNDLVYASDFSGDAVALAKRNQENNQLDNVTIIQSDWYQSIGLKAFDLIVSNPPYVCEDDSHLTQGDLVFEPKSALVADDNGLADIRVIIGGAKNFLKPTGSLMIEHGFEQGDHVKTMLIGNGFSRVKILQDLAGLDRISIGIC